MFIRQTHVGFGFVGAYVYQKIYFDSSQLTHTMISPRLRSQCVNVSVIYIYMGIVRAKQQNETQIDVLLVAKDLLRNAYLIMGVTGLWKLIDQSGKPVPLDTLENKILAVGKSILTKYEFHHKW